jgi:hypothetical protein
MLTAAQTPNNWLTQEPGTRYHIGSLSRLNSFDSECSINLSSTSNAMRILEHMLLQLVIQIPKPSNRGHKKIYKSPTSSFSAFDLRFAHIKSISPFLISLSLPSISLNLLDKIRGITQFPVYIMVKFSVWWPILPGKLEAGKKQISILSTFPFKSI